MLLYDFIRVTVKRETQFGELDFETVEVFKTSVIKLQLLEIAVKQVCGYVNEHPSHGSCETVL